MEALTGAIEATVGLEVGVGAAGDLDLSPRGVEVRLDEGDDIPDQLGTRGSALLYVGLQMKEGIADRQKCLVV